MASTASCARRAIDRLEGDLQQLAVANVSHAVEAERPQAAGDGGSLRIGDPRPQLDVDLRQPLHQSVADPAGHGRPVIRSYAVT